MKNLFLRNLLIAVVALLGFSACNDDPEGDNPGPQGPSQELLATATKLNTDIESIQALVTAAYEADAVTDIVTDPTTSAVQLSLKSGAKIKIPAGTPNTKLPAISVAGETPYWTLIIDGKETALTGTADSYPVSSSMLPVFSVTDDSEWALNWGGEALTIATADGKAVKAVADENVSLFKGIDYTSPETLSISLLGAADAEIFYTIELPREDVAFDFYPTSDGLPQLFEYGQTIELPLDLLNITAIEDAKELAGWTAVGDVENQTVKITAPAVDDASAKTDGEIVIKGTDKNGNKLTASYAVYTLDYTNPNGTFFVINGNMGSENGTLNYLDQYLREHTLVYEKANDQHQIGNVLEDMYIANGKVYLLTQNGPSMGGDGFLVVCNGRTMQKEKAYTEFDFFGTGKTPWMQHLVVVSDTKAYVQYRDYGGSGNSGIRVVNPSTGEFAAQDIDLTNGNYDTEGAWFARMAHSKGKIFVPCRKNLVIIDVATDNSKAVRLVTDDSSLAYIKDVVKAADGYIYALVTGNYTGSNYFPTFTTNARLVKLDHEGTILADIELPETAKIGVSPSDYRFMSSSFTGPRIYIKTGSRYLDGGFGLYYFDTTTQEFKNTDLPVDQYFYGYLGEHPITGMVYCPYAPNWMSTEIKVYDPAKGFTGEPEKIYAYQTASPEGVTFGYRFWDEWINK